MNVKAKVVSDYDELKEAGDCLFSPILGKNEWLIHFVCPCGCGDITGIQVGPEQKPKVWRWNGIKENLTVTPSIRRLDRCQWHGFLTNGEFISC